VFGTVFPNLPFDIERLRSFMVNLPESRWNKEFDAAPTAQAIAVLTSSEIDYVLERTLPALKHRPFSAAYIRTPPYRAQDVHIDRATLATVARVTALNIVLEAKGGHSRLCFVDYEGTILEEFVSEYPTLYRVDVPHFGDNSQSDERRVVFTGCYRIPYDQLVDDLLV
jgi:hypothetical protein